MTENNELEREKLDIEELVRAFRNLVIGDYEDLSELYYFGKDLCLLEHIKSLHRMRFTNDTLVSRIVLKIPALKSKLERNKPYYKQGLTYMLEKEFEYSKEWYSKEHEKAETPHEPMFKPDLLFRIAEQLSDYKLPQRVELSASIGYNPKQKSSQRYSSLRSFYFQDGRSKSQMMKDRTFKKIDSEVIDTLKSIKENDKDGKVQEIVGEMLRAYELTQCLNLEKALRKYK